MPPQMPKRRKQDKPIISLYKFSDLLGKSAEELKQNTTFYIFIDDTDLLKENFDFFKSIINLKNFDMIYSKDYEALLFIEENMPDYSNFSLALVDDAQNIDRSYINLDNFQKSPIIIPLIYCPWGIRTSTNPKVCYYQAKGTYYPSIPNGIDTLSLDDLKKIKEIIHTLGEKYSHLTDLEKTILISNYIQNSVQYVDENNISEGIKGIYITDSQGIQIGRNVHTPETVLLNNFGVCEGIANATTILLNNPTINVDARSVRGSGHAWNVIQIDGKYYYVDNTWNITRNPNQYPESLKASSFSSEYLLFGQDMATKIGHHNPDSIIPQIEQGDFNQETISEVQKRLVKVADFSNYNKPVFASKLQKD